MSILTILVMQNEMEGNNSDDAVFKKKNCDSFEKALNVGD